MSKFEVIRKTKTNLIQEGAVHYIGVATVLGEATQIIRLYNSVTLDYILNTQPKSLLLDGMITDEADNWVVYRTLSGELRVSQLEYYRERIIKIHPILLKESTKYFESNPYLM
ncbi:hypothetical protein LIS04_185 [Listeria phage LIS04]|nr:hypothetical protein LIS04_185 [Listeria phage LIS04]